MEKRQRKYRAWHVERKEMLYSDFSIIATSPSWSGTQNYGGNNEELRILLREWDTKRGDLLGGDYTLIDWACFSDLIVMDWAGLPDENDSEIFEGDIISFELPLKSASIKISLPVTFYRGMFCVVIDGAELPLCDLLHKVVIGNIYQNPELVTV